MARSFITRSLSSRLGWMQALVGGEEGGRRALRYLNLWLMIMIILILIGSYIVW